MFFILIISTVVLACQAGAISPKQVAPRFPVDGRIVGGLPIKINEVPYQVSLQYGGHMCGGSIISKRWILSASHCIEDIRADRLQIRVGSSYRTKPEGRLINVTKIVGHPRYDTDTIDYDYALIELSEDLTFSETVQSVALPDQDEEIEVGSKCLVSGWGQTQNVNETREQLRAVVVPIIDHKTCQKQYEVYSKVTDKMICAGFDKGGKDACQGDSGGPLVHEKVLVGVVSWGKGCALSHYPGIYANVAAVRDWIKEVSDV